MKKQVLEYVRTLSSKSFKAGEEIYQEGALPDNTMYFIFSGEVGIFKKRLEGERELIRLSTGNFFGEMALIHERPRLATARVVSPEAHMAVMDRRMLLKLAGSSPEFIFYLLRHAVSRLLAAEDKLERVKEELQSARTRSGL